ncbi:ribonuclease T2-like protein [Powellomyces hirtus]|nr:ribonuclease T2-like protein [Powellomyces hirtus]
MQLTSALITLGALVATGVNAATLPFNPLAGGGSCSINAVACKSSAPSNTCCLPTYGTVVFAQQWLPGYCKGSPSTCEINNPAKIWTVHGAWPNTCAGKQINNCPGMPQYSDVAGPLKSYDSGLVSKMNQYWVSYKGDNNAFWVHEWGKHGTCYSPAAKSCFSPFKTGQDIFQYFNWVLTLRTKFELGRAMSAAGISPGGTYTKAQIKAAITDQYPDLQVALKCTGGYLAEVYAALYATSSGGVAGAPLNDNDTCGSSIKY